MTNDERENGRNSIAELTKQTIEAFRSHSKEKAKISNLVDLVAAETKADLDLVNSIPEIVKSAIDGQYEHANEAQKKVLDEMRAQDPYEIVSESVNVYAKHLGFV